MPQQPSDLASTESSTVRAPTWPALVAGAPGVILAFAWGVAEGTLFFFVPDVLISLAAALDPRRAWKHVIAAALGAVLAGAIMFGWAVRDPVVARDAVARVPFVSARMLANAESRYQSHGIGALFIAAVTGVPYKIYAVVAPAHVSEPAFLLATFPARAYRFVAVWAIAGLFGAWLRNSRRLTPSQILAIHIGMWTVFYAIYWSVI